MLTRIRKNTYKELSLRHLVDFKKVQWENIMWRKLHENQSRFEIVFEFLNLSVSLYVKSKKSFDISDFKVFLSHCVFLSGHEFKKGRSCILHTPSHS